MTYKASESDKNDAYNQGYNDAQKGDFSPPSGNTFIDIIFSPIDALAGSPSTQEYAEATAESYRAGHSAGSR
jgi:hypothetical protein